jgi:peptidoglycan/LPS O-acetylase OafA/YrhL
MRTARSALPILAASILLVFVWCATTRLFLAVLHPIRELLIALFFGALPIVCVTALPSDRVGRFFTHPAMRFFGTYSYGIYVFQGIIAYYLYDNPQIVNAIAGRIGSHLLAMLLQAAVGVGFSILIAVMSYEWFEKPFLRLKRWFGEETPAELQHEANRDQFSAGDGSR